MAGCSQPTERGLILNSQLRVRATSSVLYGRVVDALSSGEQRLAEARARVAKECAVLEAQLVTPVQESMTNAVVGLHGAGWSFARIAKTAGWVFFVVPFVGVGGVFFSSVFLLFGCSYLLWLCYFVCLLYGRL